LAITSNDHLHERMVMYTDVAGALRGLRENHTPAELHVGLNLRMAELLGAVALVQLQRLDDLIAAMRRNKTRICEAIRERMTARHVRFRVLNDPEGDTGLAIMLIFPTAQQAQFATEALAAEGAGPLLLYHPDKPDFHVSAHWIPIMHQQTWSERGGPWRWHQPAFAYDPQDCRKSLDILGRTVQLHVSPDLTDEQCDELAGAVNKILDALEQDQ
jgi:dTDP-4-amino-4,6-dideoxygalactose transaminase